MPDASGPWRQEFRTRAEPTIAFWNPLIEES